MKAEPLREKLRAATSDAILDAAEYVAAREGLANAALQAIAQRAGVAVGTIYSYFSDKNGLFEGLFARRREELFHAIDAAAKEHARRPFEAQLDAFVRAVLRNFDARRDYLRIALETEHSRPKIVKGEDGRKSPAMKQLQDRAERVIRIGVREKRLREDDADLFATVLVATLKGILVARSLDGRPIEPEAPRAIRIFLAGAGR